MQTQYFARRIGTTGALHGCGLALLFMTSCFEPQLENIGCARGDECPPGLVCDGALYTCVAPEQATADIWRCGNGLIDTGERCDDGNRVSGDGCSENCLSDETCGNGVIDTVARENCDDGNTRSGDGCSATCRQERCGSSGECQGSPECGDGTQDPGEQCDEGGESAKCDDNCTVAYCGDGELNTARGEQCDDAGESMSCDWDCTLRVCGDHTVNTAAGEQCDDGNIDVGDGCSAVCMIERGGAMPGLALRPAAPVL